MINVKEKFEVIFHKNNGITLQTDNYCHLFYNQIEPGFHVCNIYEASKRVSKLLMGKTSKKWKDNEPDKRIVSRLNTDIRYSHEEIMELALDPDIKNIYFHLDNCIYIEFHFLSSLFRIMDKLGEST